MNCIVCQKPVEEHGEGLHTDLCVARKAGWLISKKQGTWELISPEGITTKTNVNACARQLFDYSSPTMSADTWGLVESIDKNKALAIVRYEDGDWWVGKANAPTAPLAICRAFLAKEEE